jgi:2'-5' RNA ligase
MRLFFAVWPPPEAAEALHHWALLAGRATGGRPAGAGAIHLTLAFLGETDEARLAELKALRTAGRGHLLPLECALHRLRQRIVWVAPRKTPEALAALAGALAGRLAEGGFRTEARPFAAHVTLVRKTRERGELPPLPEVRWPVAEFLLVRSRLSAAGTRYETLARYALG